ncbi:MAG: type I glyceraldehyde-3-phosphate dehydrogenase [Alcanivoracaceae bacterium]|jgi:glyceraldehyde 3-phosphate dehydrogenase|nr:type I glyceraldehyde-3-phosphate dehydrogenase [Alcanivoracaceae bacterium]
MIRIAINGYGRIGRCLVRAIHEQGLQEQICVVAINDLTDFGVLAHLTRHDTTHGHFAVPVSLDGEKMQIGGWTVQMCKEKEPGKLPWQQLGVDIAVECSGKFKTRAALQGHLDAGARRVLASFPVEDADRTVVLGVNDSALLASDLVVSNASCTTNCLAPLVKVLDDAFGLEQGQMTTIHAYTNDQNLIDKAHNDYYRARSATMSMIPTKTGAAKAVGLVLPHLKGKLDGMAIRVPTINVSMVDLHCLLKQEASVETINQALREAAGGALKGILGVNEEPLVSWDFNHNPLSSIVDLAQTRVMGRQAKLMSWYDNEWGFTSRMVELLLKMA